MAAPTESVTTEQPPYPSWSELVYTPGINYSKEYRRLSMPLQGEYPAAISVASEDKMVTDLEPFYNVTTGEWHEIADLPVSAPYKISSVKVDIRELEPYESHWAQFHSFHPKAEYVTYGDLDDDIRPYACEMAEDGS